MQKAYVFALLAPVFYALGNVIMEQKFAKFNNLTLLIGIYISVVAMAFLLRLATKTDDPSYNFPAGTALFVLLFLSAVLFAGDYTFVGVYTNGGDAVIITLLMALLPVFVSVFKLIGSQFVPGMVYVPPNAWLIVGYILAVSAVACILKGIQPPIPAS